MVSFQSGGFFGFFACEALVALYTPCILCGFLPIFYEFCAYLSKNMKTLRCDKGVKLTLKEFEEYCENHEICQPLTVP